VAIKIHNTLTNVVGRTKTERLVSKDVWQREVLPAAQSLLKANAKLHKALIGKWVISLVCNDDHMHEFFVKNWKVAPAHAEPHVQCYVINGVKDRASMMTMLGLKTDADLRAHRDGFLKALEDKKFRGGLRDPKLSSIEKYSDAEQIEIALFSPATVYCSDSYSFLTLNTNYYGQLKSKSSLGPLEEYLIRKANCARGGTIQNPKEVWLSMHAGSNVYVTNKKEQRGIVIIAPTGTGKSTHGYGLVEAKKENRLHSDDWVFVNIGTREVLISENQFYMRTNIAEIYPHLIPLLVNEPLENVNFSPDIVELLEKFKSPEDIAAAFKDGRVSQEQYGKIVAQMIENNSARSLIDPRLMVGDKFVEHALATDIFLMKRDYDDPILAKRIDEKQMIEIMTSKGNVFNYAYGKVDPDGYGIPQSRTTEIYYNPYLCDCRVDMEKGIIGPLDQVRIEAYKTLARHKEVKIAWMNTRLPASQMQQCIRKYMEEDYSLIEVKKGNVDKAILDKLKLTAKKKDAIEGRRPMDLTGFYDAQGKEMEIIAFYKDDKLADVTAFPLKA
jgi:hypothetical protein